MKTKRFLRDAMLAAAMLTGMTAFYSCSQDEGEAPGDADRVAVQFTSQVAGADMATQKAAAPKTRTAEDASGTRWTAGDQVGIFMLNTTVGTLPGGILSGVDDVQHNVNPVTGALTPADAAQTIYYPQSGKVDFIAYYPYRVTPGTTPYIYKVTIAPQNTAAAQAAVDVLYSNNVTGVSRSHTPVALAFDHALAKLVINVKSGAGMSGANFSAMGASLRGFPTTADLSLADGTTFTNPEIVGNFAPLKVSTANGSVATYEAILIPQPAGGTDRTVVFMCRARPLP